MEQDFQPSNPVAESVTRPLVPRSQEIQGVLANSAGFLDAHYAEFNALRASVHALSQAQQLQPASSSSSSINTPESSVPPALDPQLLAAIVAAVSASLPRLSEAKFEKSEKLPDVNKYDGEVEKLDAWEDDLVQRLYDNEDRYLIDAEFRLTITRTIHNLMKRYIINGLCTLTSFENWRPKLREACGNRFEEEYARLYLRDTLKQGLMSFDEYYNLFIQKKERYCMQEASLIDAIKTNVNYATQAAAIA